MKWIQTDYLEEVSPNPGLWVRSGVWKNTSPTPHINNTYHSGVLCLILDWDNTMLWAVVLPRNPGAIHCPIAQSTVLSQYEDEKGYSMPV